MKILKSIGRTASVFLFLTVFLIGFISNSPCYFKYDPHKIVVIGNSASSINRSIDNPSRAKNNFLEPVLNHRGIYFGFLLSYHSFINIESSPSINIHLPTKSDRAPPIATT